jgi:hypothetical protein
LTLKGHVGWVDGGDGLALYGRAWHGMACIIAYRRKSRIKPRMRQAYEGHIEHHQKHHRQHEAAKNGFVAIKPSS